MFSPLQQSGHLKNEKILNVTAGIWREKKKIPKNFISCIAVVFLYSFKKHQFLEKNNHGLEEWCLKPDLDSLQVFSVVWDGFPAWPSWSSGGPQDLPAFSVKKSPNQPTGLKPGGQHTILGWFQLVLNSFHLWRFSSQIIVLWWVQTS